MEASPAPAIFPDQTEETPFLVDIERFQGPLDLLLHLIRKQDIDILDIPIARITRQFLTAVEEVKALDLDSAGEFLEMAATLIGIKAQLLLPRPVHETDDDPRAELVRRLLEYEQIREISRRLRHTEADRAKRFKKGFIPVRPIPPEQETVLETTWMEVLAAAIEVRVPDPRDLEHTLTIQAVSMDEKAELILAALRGATSVEFSQLIRPFRQRVHGVMTFLAGLELTRRRLVRLRQSRPFHELWFYRREDDASGPADGEEASQ